MRDLPATLTPVDDERLVLRETDDALATSILSGDTPAEDTVETRAWARGRKHWLNYNAFRAKLYALGVYEDTHWPIVLVRDYIEPLSLPEEVWRAYELGIPTYPHELGMETAMTWLRVAGAQIFACDKIFGPKGNRTGWNPRTLGAPGISGGTWNGVDGYHPDRWRHWKDILKAIVKGEKGAWRPNVIEAANVRSYYLVTARMPLTKRRMIPVDRRGDGQGRRSARSAITSLKLYFKSDRITTVSASIIILRCTVVTCGVSICQFCVFCTSSLRAVNQIDLVYSTQLE